ncbi:hypothetical protein AB1N83_013281 [Pleurotus pulmonarius]
MDSQIPSTSLGPASERAGPCWRTQLQAAMCTVPAAPTPDRAPLARAISKALPSLHPRCQSSAFGGLAPCLPLVLALSFSHSHPLPPPPCFADRTPCTPSAAYRAHISVVSRCRLPYTYSDLIPPPPRLAANVNANANTNAKARHWYPGGDHAAPATALALRERGCGGCVDADVDMCAGKSPRPRTPSMQATMPVSRSDSQCQSRRMAHGERDRSAHTRIPTRATGPSSKVPCVLLSVRSTLLTRVGMLGVFRVDVERGHIRIVSLSPLRLP